ncbi:MAG: hypothetical protein GWP09_01035 [Nitrospiraceae bacterium]|nr:hypothetical protein [Nitrospiraceae bacterium]
MDIKKNDLIELLKGKGEKSHFSLFLLLLIVITGFILIVSFSVFYTSSVISSGTICNCAVPIPWVIVLISSFGFFIGALVAFIYVNKMNSEKNELSKKIENLVRKEECTATKKLVSLLLSSDESQLLLFLMNRVENSLDGNAWIYQSKLESELKMSRVKLHRYLKKFEHLGLIKRERYGKTFKVEYNPLFWRRGSNGK